MRSKTFPELASAGLIIILLSAGSATATYHRALVGTQPMQLTSFAKDDADPISGEWDVTFHAREHTTPGTFTLKLDGTKVTGTVISQHTGPGTIRDGSWNEGKLSLTLVFQKHESITITGVLKDGKLGGGFQTEGFTDKWEAKKVARSNE